MSKILKRVLFCLLAVLAAGILIVGIYVAYVAMSYSRIPDNETTAFEYEGEPMVEVGKEYKALTYNVGFGAYDHAFSFFMDEGYLKNGTKTVGEYSRAESKDAVLTNTRECASVIKKEDPDFALLQEVDNDADRSYHVNQTPKFMMSMKNLAMTSYAKNFHTAYLFYPPTKPIGKIKDSGLLTMSKFYIEKSVRKSLPVSDAFPTKFFDLDRCFSVNYLPIENSKKYFVLINTHPSAYDEGGVIRKEQMEMLAEFMDSEYKKDNFVLCGGDFNHALFGTEDKYLNEMKKPDWVATFDEKFLPKGFSLAEPSELPSFGTCRDESIPYKKGYNYEVIIDGFIVSDNIKAKVKYIDADYVGSDHNPVALTFKLK
jgi:endonuclease/exonuclease/phosphatase family metal-dependent hydrolase